MSDITLTTAIEAITAITLTKGSPKARIKAHEALKLLNTLELAPTSVVTGRIWDKVTPSAIKNATPTHRFTMTPDSKFTSITIAKDAEGRTYAKLTLRDSGKVEYNIIHDKKMWWFGCNHAEYVASTIELAAA